jgi:hypothetical protein
MRGVLLGALLALVVAAPASGDPIEIGDPVGCVEAAPAAITPPPFADPIDIRVLVLLDGVTEARAEALLQTAGKPYEPLALRLKPVGYRSVEFNNRDSIYLLDEAQAAVGGGRPPGVDLVYTFTNKNMTGTVGDSVAGQAECIGGVAWADYAFAVGEADSDKADVIAAHEIGHLLGAHHHHANCVEAASLALPWEMCTLMINDVGLAAMQFSSLNGAIVRGHAEAYLPGDAHVSSPPPPPQSEPAPEPTPAPASEPSPPPSAEPQPAPAGPAPAAAPAAQPADDACPAARHALARARTAVKTARARLARARTPLRRRALRRAVAARSRAERTTGRACAAH